MTEGRFLLLADVAAELNISAAQTYALVRSGVLPAIKVGGRGQWRVERVKLEQYIQSAYRETRAWVESHPFALAVAASPELSQVPGDEDDTGAEKDRDCAGEIGAR